MADKTGGPAFPREDYQADDGPGQRGMNLRDYFAAKSMIAGVTGSGWEIKDCDAYAGWCYAMADAMLKEREK